MKSKKVNRKRNKAITIRMNEAEYNSMMSKMKDTGLTQQTFIIGSVMGATLLTDEGLQELKTISEAYADILRQLRGMGDKCEPDGLLDERCRDLSGYPAAGSIRRTDQRLSEGV